MNALTSLGLRGAGILLMTATLSAQVTRSYDVIALQGDPAPIASPTATYGIFGVDPRIGANGDLAFGGFVNNNGANNYAIWTGKPGAVVALAVQNDPAPGRPGELLDVFVPSSAAPYWVCPDGSIGFEARAIEAGGARHAGVWVGKPGALEEVAIVNHPAPDFPAATFADFTSSAELANGPFLTNGEGEVVIRGKISGGGVSNDNDTAIWFGTPGTLSILAREGGAAGGLAEGAQYDDFTFAKLALNARGKLCFIGRLRNTPIASNQALFLGDHSAVTAILRKGDAIAHPSLVGSSWGAFDKPRLNNDGSILFESTPSPGGNRSFFLRHANGDIDLIAQENVAPPGVPGSTWGQLFFSKPVLSGNNFVAFNAGLDPGAHFDQDGIWFARDGSTHLVTRKGEAAPGLPGQLFDAFQWITTHRGPAITSSGAVVFRAMTDTGADGLWLWQAGETQLLLEQGDSLDLGNGDVRRVASFSVKLESGGQSGEPSCLNDRGQLVFRASFNTGALGTAIIMIRNVLDRDSDGIDTLLERAFGGDPDDPSDGRDTLPTITSDESNLILTFLRRTDGPFSYGVESSSDLEDWNTLAVVSSLTADQSDLPPGTERVSVNLPLSSESYARVQVNWTGP